MYKGVGRTNFPTGSDTELKKSIEKLFLLPDDIFVYPGHGIGTTIKDEKERYLC